MNQQYPVSKIWSLEIIDHHDSWAISDIYDKQKKETCTCDTLLKRQSSNIIHKAEFPLAYSIHTRPKIQIYKFKWQSCLKYFSCFVIKISLIPLAGSNVILYISSNHPQTRTPFFMLRRKEEATKKNCLRICYLCVPTNFIYK